MEQWYPAVAGWDYNGMIVRGKGCAVNRFYYYGARYYNPRTSVWLSTDPLQEKYPNISTYAYTFLNPVKFIDPDGRAPGDVVVAFGGADLFKNGGKGLAGDLISAINAVELNKSGGQAKSFTSDYWGSSLSDAKSLDKATQNAFDFIKENYNYDKGTKVKGGIVIIEGYSYGGVLATHLAKRLENENIPVELLILVDAAAGPQSEKVDRNISNNVKETHNYYQETKSLIRSRGYEANGRNVKNTVIDTPHSEIDDKTFQKVGREILSKLRNSVRQITD